MIFSVNVFANNLYYDTNIYFNGSHIGNFKSDNVFDNSYKIGINFNKDADVNLGIDYLGHNQQYIFSVDEGSFLEIIDVEIRDSIHISTGVAQDGLSAYFMTNSPFYGVGDAMVILYFGEPKLKDLNPQFDIDVAKIIGSVDFSSIDYINYEVYLNGELYLTSNKSKFEIKGLSPFTDYNILIKGIPKRDWGTPYEKEFSLKTLSMDFSLTQETTVSENIIKFEPANTIYEVMFEDKKYTVKNGLLTLKDLKPSTGYKFSARRKVDSFFTDWKEFNFTTLAWTGVPEDTGKIKVINYDTTSITVQVDYTKGAMSYQYLLDDNLVSEISDLTFTYTDLEPDTQYKLSVIAKNAEGSSDPASIDFKTSPLPTPTVYALTSSIVDTNNYLIRNISWSSKSVNDGFSIYIDDNKYKDVSSNVHSEDIDFSELGYDSTSVVNVKVSPLDLDGVSSVIDIDLSFKGVGSSSIDMIIVSILKGLNLMLIAGVNLLLKLIPFIILFFAIRWLFGLFKRYVSSSSSVSHSNSNIGSSSVSEYDSAFVNDGVYSSDNTNEYKEWKEQFNSLNDGSRDVYETLESIQTNSNESQRDNSLQSEISRLR